MDDSGDFMVTSVCYVHDTVEACNSLFDTSAPKDPYLLCVSGLMIGASLTVRTHLLFEFISSQIGFIEVEFEYNSEDIGRKTVISYWTRDPAWKQ